MRSKQINFLCFLLLLAFSCQDIKKENSIQPFYGVYNGYCIVGNIRGKAQIKLDESGATVMYSVVVPSSIEEEILGTGNEMSATESGQLKNIQLTYLSNGNSEFTGEWINNDKSVGSGNFRLFLSPYNINSIVCSIYSTAVNWEYTGTLEFSDSDFKNLSSVFRPDYANPQKLSSKSPSSTVDIENIKGKLSVKDSILEVKRKCPDFFSIQDQSLFNNQIEIFVNNFYNSLEQSREENEEAYDNHSKFKRDDWKFFLYDGISFSSKRLECLTGKYHFLVSISLENILDIIRYPDKIIVRTNVVYFISEEGEFWNEEELIFIKDSSGPIFVGWFDIKPKLIRNEYVRRDDAVDTDLYYILGNNSHKK